MTDPVSIPPKTPSLFWNARLGWTLAVLIALLRVGYCAMMPHATGDVIRLLVYGRLILDHGLWVAGFSLTSYDARYLPIVWSIYPIGYPVGSLLFFTGVAAIQPTMFFFRLVLTSVEAVNACLVWRLTGRGCLGLFYWAAPISIWWVSREAQFEPLQNLPALLALLLLARRPWAAMLCLAIAVQMKVTAILLLPWFLVEIWKRNRGELLAGVAYSLCWAMLIFASLVKIGMPIKVTAILILLCLLIEIFRRNRGQLLLGITAFIVGFSPSFIAQFHYRAFQQPFLYTHPLVYNPYWWNFFDKPMFLWNPAWMIALHQLTVLAALTILISGIILPQSWAERMAWVAPLAYLAFVKTHTNVQFWYFLIWPTLILPLPDGPKRRWLFLLWPLLDFSSIASICYPPFQQLQYQPSYVFMQCNPFDPVRPFPFGSSR